MSLLGELPKMLLGVGPGKISLGRKEESKHFEGGFEGGNKIMVVGREDSQVCVTCIRNRISPFGIPRTLHRI